MIRTRAQKARTRTRRACLLRRPLRGSPFFSRQNGYSSTSMYHLHVLCLVPLRVEKTTSACLDADTRHDDRNRFSSSCFHHTEIIHWNSLKKNVPKDRKTAAVPSSLDSRNTCLFSLVSHGQCLCAAPIGGGGGELSCSQMTYCTKLGLYDCHCKNGNIATSEEQDLL